MKKRIISAILGTLFTTSVLADTSGYYAGASALSAESDLAGESKYNSGYEIHLGYNINSSFAVEVSYLDLGGYNFNQSNTEYSIDNDAFSISTLYSYPIGNFNLIGKLGFFSQSSDISINPVVDNYSHDSDYGFVVGAGLSYMLSKTIELKTEFNIAADTNYGAIGFNLYF